MQLSFVEKKTWDCFVADVDWSDVCTCKYALATVYMLWFKCWEISIHTKKEVHWVMPINII